MAVAAVSSALSIPALQARAEGNVIPPDEAAALARAHAEEVRAAATALAGREDVDTAGAGQAAKSEKGARITNAAKRGGSDDTGVEATASLPIERPVRSRLARTNAAKAAALKPLIVRFASENGLPYELADAVVRLESRYNPGARNGPNIGLTQINYRTAQSLGYQGSVAGLLDAETNLRYGLKYLAQAYKLAGGDTCGTILRYQFGHRTTAMTKASRAYCAKVKVITAAAD
ncbi:lytic transglycosylase domain-containing protein [Microvirga makkahensis]|nr:lytic transglycosylase domain-containing protein [Microvirga makkahensis]